MSHLKKNHTNIMHLNVLCDRFHEIGDKKRTRFAYPVFLLLCPVPSVRCAMSTQTINMLVDRKYKNWNGICPRDIKDYKKRKDEQEHNNRAQAMAMVQRYALHAVAVGFRFYGTAII